MANTYTPQTWTDGVSSLSAARMGVIETGVQGAWAREFNYVQFTANVSVTATTEATANTVATAGAVTYDGSTAAFIEFSAALVRVNAVTSITFYLYDGAASIGNIGQLDVSVANAGGPVRLSRRLTPSAAAHTYSIRASVGSGTGTVFAGAGGLAAVMPGFILSTRA